MAYFDRRVVRNVGRDDLPGYPGSGEDAGPYPAIVEFLTRDRYEDLELRQRGTVLLFVEGGRLKVCLTDKDQGMVGFLAVDTLDTLLGAVEKGLQANTVDWRKQRGQRGAR